MKKDWKKYLLIGIVALAFLGLVYAGITINAANNELDETLIELTVEELKTKIENEDDFILVFTSTTCSHCATYKPKLKEILLENDIVAYEILEDNISEDDNAFITSLANYSGTPTTIFVEDGEEVSSSTRIVGDKNTSEIESRLKAMGYID